MSFYAHFLVEKNSMLNARKAPVDKPGPNEHFRLHLNKVIWNDIEEYKEEYKFAIKLRDKSRMTFYHQSPQMNERKALIKYMKDVAADKHLTHCCLHLAVYLLDIFMDNHTILTDKLYLVVNVCLLLAAKVEETNLRMPKISELDSLIDNKFSVKEYKAMELFTLQFYNWYIMFATSAHYTHYFINASVNDDDLQCRLQSHRTLIFELHDAVRIYLDKCVDDVHFMQFYAPTKLAAAVISAARVKIGLCSWTKQLENLTDIFESDIKHIRDLLLQVDPLKCLLCSNA